MLLAMEAEFKGILINENHLKSLVNTLEFFSTPSSVREVKALEKHLGSLRAVIIEILGGLGVSMKEDANTELGAYYHDVAASNNLGDVSFADQPTSVWKDKYDEGRIYPLEAIESYLRRARDAYEKEHGQLLSRFFAAIDDLDIVKSEAELVILEAHDMIRKMMDKPIYYNTSKTDNYVHVNQAIDILDKKHRVRVSANEIEKIVHNIDSLENLSKQYGIPSESVYFLKASFR